MDTRILSQREHARRGFTISHQKVVLEVDFTGSLYGYTELTIIPATTDLRTLHLHSRQCTIHSISVAGHAADFVHHDPLSNISFNSPSEAADCHRHPEFKRKLYSALQESDEGELSIAIPNEVAVKHSGQYSSHLVVNDVSTPEPQTPGGQSQSLPEFAPIVVHIVYSLRNPVDGFQFILPTDAYPYRVPHAYTTPSSPDSARCWVPCIDNLWERCTWEFEFVVPRYLEEPEPTRDEDEPADLIPTVVVCSGELQEQVAHPNNSNKTIFVFSQPVLTSAQHVAFAAGPFQLYSIPAEATSDDSTSTVAQPPMYAFGLPGHESLLRTSTSFLRSAMSFYSTEYGSYPFGSYKLVFVDELPTQRFDNATMSLVTVDLLHGEDAIDQAIETRHTLSHALACQWAGINIIPKAWSDIWLTNGLALYITGLFLRKLFGNNDYRFRLKKDMQRVAEWDVGGMPPICQPQVLDPPDAASLPFINLKAPLVLHILDRQLGKSGTSLGLSRILPKVFLSALSGELPNNALSTHTFLRVCRKVSGVEPRTFAEQWIYGSGCPSFGFSASFNRKKMAVEITMRQECPAYQAHENNEINRILMKPVPFFEGQMTIRIHEADGTPYEHVLDIWAPFKRYEVPFNTKYKRVRRNTKRYLARQAAAQAAAEGDAEAAEAMGMVDMGFGLEIWEKEQERENWKVADWTEEDENVMSGSTYEWIRMDADFEWIANIKFDQPDFMWVSQLQRDRDVVAQLEAVHALAEKPTPIVSSTLTKTVLVSNYYFRIRCEAALALVNCSIHRLEFLGLFHLFKLFLRYCYDPEDPKQDLFMHKYVPKPNDFSDIPEYFVRKSLVNAISRVRFDNGKTPAVVRQFIIDQLRYNDNTANPYSDAFYICTIISAAACAFVSTAPPERGELLPSDSRNEQSTEDAGLVKQIRTEVDRYRSMDRLIPSPHNIVTIATLEFYMMLGVANLTPVQTRVFFPLTREGNYTQVRIAAFDGLFLTKWYTPQVMRYILAVIANDSSRIVRRHVARNACYSLALLVQMGEMKATLKESESLLIEEDGNLPEKSKDSKKSELDAMIKVLRKDREIGKNEVLREFVMPIALAPGVDHEVRWCILKLCDILIRPFEETAPTAPSFKIHIPSTPITETAPSLPTPKVAIKPPRVVKSGGPPSKSPLVPLTTPAKLKLPAVPRVLDTVPRTPATPIAEPSKKGVAFVPPAPSTKVVKPKGRPPKAIASKPVQVPKAQSGGMSLNDLRACRSALKKLKANKHALLFLQPVDPIRDHAPNYFEVIKDPMDLSTMGAKLEEGMYKDRFAFQTDFRLIISNAKLYNAPGSFVHNEAIAIETFFEKQWTIINKTLQAADRAHPPPTRPTNNQTPRTLPPVPKAFPSSGSSTTPSHPAPPPSTPSAAPDHSTPAVAPSRSIPSASSSRVITPVPETPTPSGVPARPTIKLKMGSKPKAPEPVSVPSNNKSKKSKLAEPPIIPTPSLPTAETPPPEYVDDGSHDLLQEVIALENEQRRRSVEKTNGAPKRKKADLLDDDDILALATPSKKEKPSPPGPSGVVSKPSPAPVTAPSTSGSTAKPITLAVKPKKEKPQEITRPVPSEVPRNILKGKQKEVVLSPSPQPVAPKQKKQPTVQSTLMNEKRCKDLIKVLQKVDGYAIFSRPVDPILDGCPTYLDEIKHPMDFGTISTKLNEGKYDTMEEFKKDVELVFSNCRQFNPPQTYPVICADAVEKAFKREWPKAMERKLSWSEKRGLQGIMTTLQREDISWLFREPVDPVKLEIPTYFDIIPRKDARDLRTIRLKLDLDKYETVETFEADMELMANNAIKFNGADSEVGVITNNFRRRYHELLAGWKSSVSKKRKDSEKGTPQPTKKIKMG